MKQEENVRAEEKIGYALVKARLLTDNQLKTALDYQRSLGGNLVDVVGKLGFARPATIQRFLAESNNGGSGGAAPAPAPAAAAASTERDAPPPPADTKLKKEASCPAPTAVAECEEPEKEEASPAGDPSPQDPAPASPRISDPVLDALVTLLIKKGVFRRRELEDLLRREGGES